MIVDFKREDVLSRKGGADRPKFEILHSVAERAGHVVTRDELLNVACGYSNESLTPAVAKLSRNPLLWPDWGNHWSESRLPQPLKALKTDRTYGAVGSGCRSPKGRSSPAIQRFTDAFRGPLLTADSGLY